MRVQILDFDGSLLEQEGLRARGSPKVYALRGWGPRIRLACSVRRFQRFEHSLAVALGNRAESTPALTFYGSGDFHHVSLALVRRVRASCNLLVLDNHPDWMRGVPFLHCGTWLNHAARLPQVRRVFHVGGDVDFDNYFRWLAPWDLIRSGKIVVIPATRRYRRGRWQGINHTPLRAAAEIEAGAERVRQVLQPYREELRRWPLYVSMDKDVLMSAHAPVNWDSGRLTLAEAQTVLRTVLPAAEGGLVGMDVVGDWSAVRVAGLFRRFLHWAEHPRLALTPADAAHGNERTNLALLATVDEAAARAGRPYLNAG
jgi:hypothetical protein